MAGFVASGGGEYRRDVRQEVVKQEGRNEVRAETLYNPSKEQPLRSTYTTKSPIR